MAIFIRVNVLTGTKHGKYLINTDYIVGVEQEEDGCYLHMADGANFGDTILKVEDSYYDVVKKVRKRTEGYRTL